MNQTTDWGRYLALMEQLLALAKLQSGLPPLAPEPLDLAALLQQLAAALAPTAERLGRRVALELPDRPVVVGADRPALERLLRTLVAEALRERGGTVTLALREEADGVELAVRTALPDPSPSVPCSGDGDERRSLGIELAPRLAALVGTSMRCTRGSGFGLHWERGQRAAAAGR